jgi:arsenate reductase-like glutaredoxin family protein
LLKAGALLEERDLGKKPLSEAELRDLFGTRDPRTFLNPRNETYRRLDMKNHPPDPDTTIRMMAKEPNLIRRPLVVRGGTIVAGFDEAGFERLLS